MHIETFADKADREVHPLAVKAMDFYFQPGKLAFAADDVRTLQTELFELTKGPIESLGWALQSLFRFAAHLKIHRGDEAGAHRIFEVLEVAVPAMRAVNEPVFAAVQEIVRGARRETFKSFEDKKEERSAPVFGKAKASNGIALSDLRPRTTFK